jgi:hypothetical protein
MKRVLIVFFVLLLAELTYSQDIEQRYSKYGYVILLNLSTAPFPHLKRVEGHDYNGKNYPAEKHYKDSSVLVFIPNGFRQSNRSDFVVHFHGWYNNIDSVLYQFQLIEQLIQSGKNAILIIPEGPKNAPDSFGGKLEDELGFKRFMFEIVDKLYKQKKLKTKNIGNMILSGHSGGYHVMSFILMRGGLSKYIKEVYLFDALYGQTEKYVYWIDHFKGKIINIFTESGGTKGETESLIEDLKGWGIPYLLKKDIDISQKELKLHKLIFLLTDLSHNDVIKMPNFTQYLKASILKDLRK